jgi:hypothetical protein
MNFKDPHNFGDTVYRKNEPQQEPYIIVGVYLMEGSHYFIIGSSGEDYREYDVYPCQIDIVRDDELYLKWKEDHADEDDD